MNTTYYLKLIAVGLCFAFFLSACNDDSAHNDTQRISIPTLTDENINSVIYSLIMDYNASSSSLITAFNSYKKSGDAFGFTQFRNQKWTPTYMERKHYYQAAYKKNTAYTQIT